ncbi:serine/threonine-protein kinase [Streptomyces sp. HNM0663]|uniref:Serine/threonine-protein kinase n=1 Tax=Streptomyces chengmaiensis TaxID=3040919 RepID=A0ABT6HT39_9ACTN|nr:serine/threonine-protein kinase [Streptomyces chengmaiensis]MDH2391486.1 serine/threonine-protein kinase [Streptomyces chengmaiensis]
MSAHRAAPEHEPLGPADPQRIGRYVLTHRLGQGGMGTVYLGRSQGGRQVAVKLIKKEHADDTEFRRRFAREINAVRQVGGFFTAHVVDADPDAEQPWLVTEYIPGPSLRDVIRHHGPLPANTLRSLAVGVAEALEWIHKCDVIHRDLKPSNIILSLSGPRVIDFGIARTSDGTPLTRTNAIIGTKGFLAPEQYTGAALTPATDVYALGMVLCHAAGAAPFPDRVPRNAALSMLPAALAPVVTRCLETDPLRRPSPAQILADLSHGHATTDAWLPRPVRALIELHSARTHGG